MTEGYGDAIHQKLTVLQAAHETARDTYRRAIRNFYPDGLRVIVHGEEKALGQVVGDGMIVGMDLDGRLRVAIGAASVLRLVHWSSLTPILPDKA